MMRVRKLWELYREKCVASDAGESQIQQTEQAFYAGFMAMLEINTLISRPEISDSHSVMIMESILKEIKQYVKWHSDPTKN